MWFGKTTTSSTLPRYSGTWLGTGVCQLLYVGFWLDFISLSFIMQIDNLQSKIKTRLGFLYWNKASFMHSTKQALVKMTILLLFDFGDTVYQVALTSKLDILNHLHLWQSRLYPSPLTIVSSLKCWIGSPSVSGSFNTDCNWFTKQYWERHQTTSQISCIFPKINI